MIYDFTKEIKYDITRHIDVEEIRDYFENLYAEESETEKEFFNHIKNDVIKNEEEFYNLVEKFSMEPKEIINLLIFAFPDMFNHHLVKFIRKKYLHKDQSEFEKL